jgi:monoterpene epsilon-lactone hydrolase
MSLRAELLRLGTRAFLKGKPGPKASLEERRRRAAAAARWVPNPPPEIKRVTVDAGGVVAEWVTAPVSQHDRQILYLHGGGYVIGSPSLYRHLTRRLASVARARL